MTTDSARRTQTDSGVQVDLISKARSSAMGRAEKINEIIDRVQAGSVVILEEGLTPDEEGQLIEKTMTRTDGQDFTGIEIESYPQPTSNAGFLQRLIGNDDDRHLVMVGPANRIETLDKNEKLLSTLVRNE